MRSCCALHVARPRQKKSAICYRGCREATRGVASALVDDILLTKAKLQNSPAKNYKRWIVHYFDDPVELSFKKPLKQVFRQGVKLAKKLKGPIKKTVADEGARRLAISAAAAATRANNKVTAATKSDTKKR